MTIFRGDHLYCDEFAQWEKESPDLRAAYFAMADAVIDALASMEPTDAMIEAYLDQTGDPLSEFGWTAAVEAMRDE